MHADSFTTSANSVCSTRTNYFSPIDFRLARLGGAASVEIFSRRRTQTNLAFSRAASVIRARGQQDRSG
jgi:hypothetical protein